MIERICRLMAAVSGGLRTATTVYGSRQARLGTIRKLHPTGRAVRFACALAMLSGVAMPGIARAAVPCRPGAREMAKVELYMGVSGRPADWRRFLADVVTPRFPDGLTILEGQGQWRARGRLTREATRIIVIYYSPDATSEARIEAIRSLYKRRFRQLSVLRADSTACVGF